MEKGSLANLRGKTLEEIEIQDKLDLTDSESEESEAAICDPSPRTKNQEPEESSEDSIDGSGEGTSQECTRPTLTGELPGTSAGKRSTASPTEKPSDTLDGMTVSIFMIVLYSMLLFVNADSTE
ncbi:hypothetical protein GOODEAATRI_030756 [Goodea atripinnis]|uniref:Uncharacterized protein n=1 Tax=Goodea atripinnis TaxID=208336 RepID=A0ABV0PIC4_9TELE